MLPVNRPVIREGYTARSPRLQARFGPARHGCGRRGALAPPAKLEVTRALAARLIALVAVGVVPLGVAVMSLGTQKAIAQPISRAANAPSEVAERVALNGESARRPGMQARPANTRIGQVDERRRRSCLPRSTFGPTPPARSPSRPSAITRRWVKPPELLRIMGERATCRAPRNLRKSRGARRRMRAAARTRSDSEEWDREVRELHFA